MDALGSAALALVAAAIGAEALGVVGGATGSLVAGSAGAVFAGLLAALAAARAELAPAPGRVLLAAALVAGLAIAQWGWAARADAALDGGLAALAGVALFLCAALATRGGSAPRWPVALAAFGAVVAGVALWAALFTRGGAHGYPFGNPNRLGAWLLLPLGAACAGALRARREGARVGAWWAAAVLSVAALVVSGSRGAALAGALACGGTWLASRTPDRRIDRVCAVGIVAVALALFVLPLAFPDALAWARDGSESSAGIRWHVYAATAQTALRELPLGAGLGGFASAFAPQRPLALAYAPRHAHNEYSQAFVELGLPGLAIAGLVTLLWLGRSRRDPVSSLPAAAALAVGLGVALHACLDAPLRVPALVFALAWLLGLALRTEPGDGDARGPAGVASRLDAPASPALARGVLLGLALFLAWGGGSGLWAGVAELRAADALARGDFAAAEALARSGLRARPARADAWRGVAEAAEHAALLGGGGVSALARAERAWDRVVALDPRGAASRRQRAERRARAGELDAALDDLEAASRLDPAAPAPHLARARLRLARAEPGLALAAAREALRLRPSETGRVVGELLRATGDSALAVEVVSPNADAWARAGSALAAAGADEAAATAFERALTADPGDANSALQAARAWRRLRHHERSAAVLVRALEHRPEAAGLRGELAYARSRAAGAAQ